MKLLLSFFLLFFSITSCVLGSSDYKKEKTLTLSARGISKLDVNCGSGVLIIRGTNTDEIKVEVTIKIRNVNDDRAKEIIEDDLELDLDKRGSTARLISKYRRGISIFRNVQVTVDLRVTVPEEIDLIIDDGSGSMEIEDIKGEVRIDDGSGSMDIQNITGDLEIEDGSGDIDIDHIKGDVDIDDSSGSMDVRDIDGSVVVSDGSGSIRITDVENDVTIRDDGSGGVSIRRVKGKVRRRDK
jgi:DUF4097 and DUF4098 domain-containing protein YvlB